MEAECSVVEDAKVSADPPRHGLNAKALLMQAAVLAAEEAADLEERAPETLSLHDQELAQLKSAFTSSSKLLTGIPKRETPIVAFVSQTKIPRATRQLVLQKLAGQHLAMSLIDNKQDLTPDSVAACGELRKAALSAAVDQELKLFKACASKVSYSNAAARTDASLMKFPPAPAHQAKSAHNSVQQLEASKTSDLDSVTTKKRKRSESANGISESSQDKQPDEDIPSAVATNTALVDDDIDWTAISVVPDSQLVSSTDDMQAGASQLSTDGPDTGLAHSQQAEAACTNEGLQQQQGALVTHKVPSRGDDAGDKQVQHAVGEYVKALLDPFYKAGIVDREMYKLVIKKTVNKIVQTHVHAEDADFLLQESDQIQRLLRDYIRYAQKKCHK